MQSSRTNYTQETEQQLNQTIQVYLSASHTYDHLSAWASNEEINMPGFSKFFRYCSWRTWELSQRLIDWQTMRGGKYNLTDYKPMIQLAELAQYNLEKIVQCAIEIEKKIEYQLRQLYTTARSKDDMTTCEMVESKLLQIQLLLIRCMVNHYNGLRQSQNFYHYDRHTVFKMIKRLDKLYNRDYTFKTTTEYGKNKESTCPQDKWSYWWPSHTDFTRVWTMVSSWY